MHFPYRNHVALSLSCMHFQHDLDWLREAFGEVFKSDMRRRTSQFIPISPNSTNRRPTEARLPSLEPGEAHSSPSKADRRTASQKRARVFKLVWEELFPGHGKVRSARALGLLTRILLQNRTSIIEKNHVELCPLCTLAG